MAQNKCKLDCAYKHIIFQEKSDIRTLTQDVSALQATIQNMSDTILILEFEVVRLSTKSTNKVVIASTETEIKQKEQDKCDQCVFESYRGPEASKFHNIWVHLIDNIRPEFKCKVCEFISSSTFTMKSHLVLKHKNKNVQYWGFIMLQRAKV